MKLNARPEEPIKPSPFNPEALWLTAQWFGEDKMSVEVEVADLIYAFVRAVKPVDVLETGTWKGFSTKSIATGLKLNGFGKVTTVDRLDQKYIPYVLNQYRVDTHTDGLLTYEKVEADVFEAFDKFITENKKFNFIFCDDLHNDKHVKLELEYFEKLITRPGYVMFHDTYFTNDGDINKVVTDWVKEKGYDMLPFYTSRGFIIVHVK